MEAQTVRQRFLVFTISDLQLLGERLKAAFSDLYFMETLHFSGRFGEDFPQSRLSRDMSDCRWADVDFLFGQPGKNWEYVRRPHGAKTHRWGLYENGYPNGELSRYGFPRRADPDRESPFADVMVGESPLTLRALRDERGQVEKIEKVLRLAQQIAITNKCRWYAFDGAQRYPSRDEDSRDRWVGRDALSWVRMSPGRILGYAPLAGKKWLALMPRDWVETSDFPWPRIIG